MKDAHILGTSLFNYVVNNVNEEELTDENDPVAMMVSLGKLQSVLIEFDDMRSQIEEIMEEYDIDSISPIGDSGD